MKFFLAWCHLGGSAARVIKGHELCTFRFSDDAGDYGW